MHELAPEMTYAQACLLAEKATNWAAQAHNKWFPRVTLDGRGKCEGGKSLAEMRPEVVDAARALNEGRALRKIAAALADQGFVTPAGKEYSATSIKGSLHESALSVRHLEHAPNRLAATPPGAVRSLGSHGFGLGPQAALLMG